MVTRTADGFDGVKAKGVVLDGSTYFVQLPASWYYPELGQKSKNAAYWNQLSATAGSVVTYGARGNPLRGNRQGRIVFSTGGCIRSGMY